jgi:hypothetical protein
MLVSACLLAQALSPTPIISVKPIINGLFIVLPLGKHKDYFLAYCRTRWLEKVRSLIKLIANFPT